MVAPSAVTAFFTQNPNASKAYFNSTINYLANFKAKALAQSKAASLKLYEATPTTVTRIYPTLFLYRIRYDTNIDAMATIDVNNGDTATVLTSDASGIGSAFASALIDGGWLTQPVEVEETQSGIFEIRIVTGEDDVDGGVKIIGASGAEYPLIQSFL